MIEKGGKKKNEREEDINERKKNEGKRTSNNKGDMNACKERKVCFEEFSQLMWKVSLF